MDGAGALTPGRRNWAARNASRVRALQSYSALAAQVPDPLIQTLRNWEHPSRWLLLAAALRQTIHDETLSELLTALHSGQGEALWHLPPPSEAAMNSVVQGHKGLSGWPLMDMFPGICRSVADYTRSLPIRDGQICWPSAADIWRACGSIFYMGKTNPVRPKALWFLARLQLQTPLGLAITLPPSAKKLPLPPTPGARRWLRLLGPGRELWLSEALDVPRLRYYNTLYALIEDPGVAFHALELYLSRDRERHLRCRLVLGECEKCPFYPECPGKDYP